MPDSSWNTYTPSAPSRFPGWLKVFLGLAAAGALLVTALVGYQMAARRQAWPLARAIAARLATDEGTRDLYRKNPDLARLYPTETDLLDRVRPLRAGLALPAQEPRERRVFSAFMGPSQARVRVRGEGGTWLEFTVRKPSLLGPAPKGEGLAWLLLAPSRTSLMDEARRLREAEYAPRWQRFRQAAGQLASDEGAHDLIGTAGLACTPSAPEAFAALRQRRAEGLRTLPEAPAEAHVRIRQHRGPFHQELRMACELAGGGRLALTWTDDRLSAVELE